jgi:hypothetical protein
VPDNSTGLRARLHRQSGGCNSSNIAGSKHFFISACADIRDPFGLSYCQTVNCRFAVAFGFRHGLTGLQPGFCSFYPRGYCQTG